MYLVRRYILFVERLIDTWYLVSYITTVDRIRYKGRTWYNVPSVTSKVDQTRRTPRHTSLWHKILLRGVARVSHAWSLSRKRPTTEEIELAGRGCFCDFCHTEHLIRVGVPVHKCYYLEISTNIKEYNSRGQGKLPNAMIWYGFHFDQHFVLRLG